MNKHTLQEWADFTKGCVAVASDGRVFLFQERPYLSNGKRWIGDEIGMISYQLVDYSGDWRDSLTAPSEPPFKEGELLMFSKRNELVRWLVDIDAVYRDECRRLTAEEWRTLRGED